MNIDEITVGELKQINQMMNIRPSTNYGSGYGSGDGFGSGDGSGF